MEDAKGLGKALSNYTDEYFLQVLLGFVVIYILYPSDLPFTLYVNLHFMENFSLKELYASVNYVGAFLLLITIVIKGPNLASDFSQTTGSNNIVQRANNSIQWINHYLAYKIYPNQYIYPLDSDYPLDKVICFEQLVPGLYLSSLKLLGLIVS